MAMRELVSGGAACAVPGSSSSSSGNPLGALANALIGSSSKTKERLEEVPTARPLLDNNYDQQHAVQDYQSLHLDQPLSSHGSDFISNFRQNALSDVHHPPPSSFDGAPQAVLSNFLHSFVHTGVPFRAAPLPVLGLSESDKHCIRDRTTIMARHIFAHQGDHFINAQLDALFSSLDIDRPANQPMPPRMTDLERYWNDSQSHPKPAFHASDDWVSQFTAQPHPDAWANDFQRHHAPDAWANDFQRHHAPDAWANEFDHEQSQLATLDHTRGIPNVANYAAMEQSRMLANTLSQNNDPKFQNSKFLQFVSKMSRGEISIEDNQVKQSGDWATQFQQQYDPGSSWADEYVSRGTNQWVNEFTSGEAKHAPVDEQWVNEFSNLQVNDWADEFGKQVGEGAFGDATSESWANSYDEYMNEQVASKQRSAASRGVYEFSDMNPYVGHPNPLKEGQELFRKGLLSEAVLALEAEVLKNPDNAEGWRLLGIAHAENDDDQQAIAAMMRAQEADPANLEVLLALGVSHTNELEQAAALKYLYGWLRNHPKYGTLAPPDLADSLYYADVARLFNDAAQMSPEDSDVHVVLGVLYNLSREYDKAIESFQTALKLKPRDYSLWNKLGATQANSIQSADAILAYQQALDLKPNYVRAWANMGISYANQGMHEDSIRYYVRALAMNPKADNAWQYLRISLSCADRSDMLEACDSRNLDVLQKEFPL